MSSSYDPKGGSIIKSLPVSSKWGQNVVDINLAAEFVSVIDEPNRVGHRRPTIDQRASPGGEKAGRGGSGEETREAYRWNIEALLVR